MPCYPYGRKLHYDLFNNSFLICEGFYEEMHLILSRSLFIILSLMHLLFSWLTFLFDNALQNKRTLNYSYIFKLLLNYYTPNKIFYYICVSDYDERSQHGCRRPEQRERGGRHEWGGGGRGGGGDDLLYN